MSTKQNKYAVLIGIDKYHESLGNLKYAGADCRRLKNVLLSGSLGFAEDKMLLLDDLQTVDHRPTFANIHTWLSSWLAQPKEDDLVLFYFAGHGRDMEGKSYLVPGDATLSTLHTLGIPLANIQELMGRCKANNKILIIDACHSGAGRDVAPMSAHWQRSLSQSKGIYTITSCGVDELSYEWDEKKQGMFSWFLSEALSGACTPNPDGKLTIERIYEWVHEKVISWSAQHRCIQTPQRFYQGSGVITLTEGEPDWKMLAQTLQSQLSQAQQCITSFEADSKEAERHAAIVTEVRDLIRDFVQGHKAVWKDREWRTFVKMLRNRFKAMSFDDGELYRWLVEEAKQWKNCQITTQTSEMNTEYRLVIKPNKKAKSVDFLLDDEPANEIVSRNNIPPGHHKLEIIPDSYLYGIRTINICVRANESKKHVLYLRRVFHWRALASFMLQLLLGFCVAAFLWCVIPSDKLQGGVFLLYLVFGVVVSILYAALLFLPLYLIRKVRMGLKGWIDKGDDLGDIIIACYAVNKELLTLTLCGIVLVVMAASIGYHYPPNLVCSLGAICTAVIGGFSTSIIPWNENYYATRDD